MMKQAFSRDLTRFRLGFGKLDTDLDLLETTHPNFDEIVARELLDNNLVVKPDDISSFDSLKSFGMGGSEFENLLTEFEDKYWNPYEDFDQMPEYIDKAPPIEHWGNGTVDLDLYDALYDEVTTKSPYAKARKALLRTKNPTMLDLITFMKKWRGKDSYGRPTGADYAPIIRNEILDRYSSKE
jgi:hypothetical protein